MRTIRLGWVIVAVLLLAGPPDRLRAQDLDREVRHEVGTYLDLLGRGSVDRLVARHSRSPGTASIGNGQAREDSAGIADGYRRFLATGGGRRPVADSAHVVLLGPASALAWFRFRWAGGGDGGAVTLIYRREGSGWVIVHDHISLLPAVAVASPAAYQGPARPVRHTTACTVARISDGDTIECQVLGRVRLIGIDAPETDQRPHGERAEAALAAMIPPGSAILLESDSTPRDKYGRLLAYLWMDGKLVNWRMVREGWAMAYRYPPDVRWAESLERAEAGARAEARGLWGTGGFGCAPSDHRRRRC